MQPVVDKKQPQVGRMQPKIILQFKCEVIFMKFEEKLQNLRKASNLNQEQLADKLNVSRQAVSKWESGVSYPETDKLVAMTKLFNCSMDDLLNEHMSDEAIMKKKNRHVSAYIDSFLDFITRTVNMFCSMKFSSFFKMAFELIVIGIIIVLFMGILKMLGSELIGSLLSFLPGASFSLIFNLFDTVLLLIVIIISFIAFIQIYKARYLDYYDQLVYKYEQKKANPSVEEQEENNMHLEKLEEENKKSKKEEKREHIIIRDPSHRPLEFLSPISKFIVGCIKFIVLCFSICFVISFICFVVALVISAYLISANTLFIACVIGLLACLIINYQVLELIYDFIFNKRVAAMRHFITFLVAIILLGSSIGIGFIKFKDFTFISEEIKDNLISHKTTYKMQDDLIIAAPYEKMIFEIDEDESDVILDIAYDEKFSEHGIVNKKNNYRINIVKNTINAREIFSDIVADLKKNIIRDNSYYYSWNIKITTNSENATTIIKNISRRYHIEKTTVEDGYVIYVSREVDDHAYCELNDLDIYDCYEVEKDYRCSYEFKDGSLVVSDNCYCEYYDKNRYNCQLKDMYY